jgi:hypothetical protein
MARAVHEPTMTVIPTGTKARRPTMNHPLLMYDLARLRIAEDLRQAERERLVREAGSTRRGGAIDAMPFRDRIARLFGIAGPQSRSGAATAGA